ncbi:unnamed protein product [Rotaria sp. Silwood2]|nr:unnamed protein product [Rotaria sp. Silwood2]
MSGQNSKEKNSTSTMATVACTTASSSTTEPRRRMVQNYLLIWVDDTIDQANEHCQNTLTQLRSVVNDVNTFTQPDACVDFLTEVDDTKAFLIVAGTISQQMVPLIHDIAHLDSIYIFCDCKNELQHKEWAKKWAKIQGVFTSVKPICESLEKAAHQCDHDAMPMSFVPKQMMVTEASDQQNLNQLEPSFMYSILFKEIILEIDDDDTKSIKDLMAYCRQQNISESQLKDFQCEYHNKTPIWWYTRQIFLYGMLNKALRSLDIEAMMKMGFFIRSLHRQLEKLHKEQSVSYMEPFTVYRGQGLSSEDFQHLLDTKGGLLSFNNFLSTSKQQNVAMRFVEYALRKYQQILGILFIMTIDPSTVSTSTTPYALIDNYSAIPREQEILFSMHTVFRVHEIKHMVNKIRLWEVYLTLTNDNDPQLAALTQPMREKTQGPTGWHRMGALMLTMSHFNPAEDLYN